MTVVALPQQILSRPLLSRRRLSRRRILHLICGLSTVLGACGISNIAGSQAPEINYGYDTCAHCGMFSIPNKYFQSNTCTGALGNHSSPLKA